MLVLGVSPKIDQILILLMEISEFLKKMTSIQTQLIEFIDNNSDEESNYLNLYQILDAHKINQNKNDFKIFLHLLSSISEHHERTCLIFPKILNILLNYKKDMMRYFTNNEIYTIFKNNKRCVLFLFQENIISPNRFILSNFQNKSYKNYLEYCFQEVQDFNYMRDKNVYKVNFKVFSDNDHKRKRGEDEREVFELIRKDAIDDFISYVNKHKIDFSAKITPSIYETNSFLLEKRFNLIEYAAFSGSVKIFKYLYSVKADFNQSIWQYAVHGRNPEIIHIIENSDFSKEKIDFSAIYIESIKCFHNDISHYLKENYDQYINVDFREILKSYNFEYIQKTFFDEPDIFYELCHYDYINVVEILLKTTKPNFQPQKNKDSLAVSTMNCNIEIMELLLQRKEVDINKNLLLTKAIKSENEETVQLLLNHGDIKINSMNTFQIEFQYKIKKSIIFTAIEQGNLEILKMILNYDKIDVNSVSIKENISNDDLKIMTPVFYYAVEKGNIEIIKLLLNRNDINVNKPLKIEYHDFGDVVKRERKNVLNCAIEQNSTEIVKLLLDSGKIDINSESTIEMFTEDYFKKSIGIIFMISLIFPAIRKLLNNNILSFIVIGIISFIWIVTKWFFSYNFKYLFC